MTIEISQLCKTYTGKQDISGWFVEPKINGNRGLIIIENGTIRTISRNNKPIYNTDYIQQVILKAGIDNVVLDGEFYTSHSKLNNDWSTTTSILRTQTKHEAAHDINFWVFDMIPLVSWKRGIEDVPLHRRKNELLLTVNKISHSSIIYVAHRTVGNSGNILWYLNQEIEAGWEGVVFKNPQSFYECKRSSNWLKLKPVHTEEYLILGVQEGKGKYVGTTGAILIDVKGVVVSVGTGMTDLDRDEIWKDRELLKGVMLEVSYQTKTKDGSLIFPVFKRIRWDLV